MRHDRAKAKGRVSFARRRVVLAKNTWDDQRGSDATLAQSVEQLIRNQQVVGSNPTGGSKIIPRC